MLKMILAALDPCTKFAPSRHDRGAHGLLKSGLALLALAGVWAFPLASAANTLTVYDVSIVGTNASVVGTITIDGPLSPPQLIVSSACHNACIADYDLRITVDGQSVDLLGPGSGANSEFSVFQGQGGLRYPFRYSATGLFFDFGPGTTASEVLFEGPSIGLGQNLFCLSAGDNCFYPHPDGSGVVLAVGGRPGFIAFNSDVQIGVAAVPEPSTWAMMLLGFAGAGAGLRASRRRSRIASA